MLESHWLGLWAYRLGGNIKPFPESPSVGPAASANRTIEKTSLGLRKPLAFAPKSHLRLSLAERRRRRLSPLSADTFAVRTIGASRPLSDHDR